MEVLERLTTELIAKLSVAEKAVREVIDKGQKADPSKMHKLIQHQRTDSKCSEMSFQSRDSFEDCEQVDDREFDQAHHVLYDVYAYLYLVSLLLALHA